MRTIPNLDLAIKFLGSEWYWIALSACTGLSIFAGSMWALNLFCDAKFQTPAQKLRANLVGKTNRILQAIPQMTESAVDALHQIIRPVGSVA